MGVGVFRVKDRGRHRRGYGRLELGVGEFRRGERGPWIAGGVNLFELEISGYLLGEEALLGYGIYFVDVVDRMCPIIDGTPYF